MTVNIQNLCKSFSSGLVLDHLNLHLDSSKCYCLMGPSGRGKTTLLRILMGLETADSGTVSGLEQSRIGVVFQEDRLCGAAFLPSTMYVWLQISRLTR